MIRRVSARSLARLMPPRARDSHKGDYGRVLIIAGSRGMTGAAALATLGALRGGAGLVFTGIPRSQRPIVAAQIMEALTLPLPETRSGTLHSRAVPSILRFCEAQKVDVVVLGPGLSGDPRTQSAVLQLVWRLKTPMVLDADALNGLAADVMQRLRRHGHLGSPEVRAGIRRIFSKRQGATIVTPHPGEAARILGVTTAAVQRDRKSCVDRVASDLQGVAVLKGNRTLISDGKELRVNPTGNPGLAKGGTGDVLAGLIGAVWAQLIKSGTENAALEAATLAAYIHGKAADLAVRRWGTRALLAGDLPNFFPAAMRSAGIK